MKFKFIGLVISLMLFGAMPSQAVPLVDLGNNTYDPNTGLYWLDVTLTRGKSYNDVINLMGIGQPLYAYRYATAAEVSTLFTDAGITTPSYYFGPPNSETPFFQTLISLLGGADTSSSNIIDMLGIIGNLYSSGIQQEAYLYLSSQPGHEQQYAEVGEGGVNQDYRFTNVGSFLVATPLPATLPLFASGLGALGLLGWRRKRKAHQQPNQNT